MEKRARCTIHMYTTIDGKIVTDLPHYPDGPETDEAGTLYDDITFSEGKKWGCGRTTFDTGRRPDLTGIDPSMPLRGEEVPGDEYLCFAFDRFGKIDWETPFNPYGERASRVVEVLTKRADPRLPAYLEKKGIAYLFAGEDDLDPRLFLEKIHRFGEIDDFYLCGGPEINAAFLRAGVVDAISLVVCPGIQGGRKELTFVGTDDLEGFPLYFEPAEAKIYPGGALRLLYRKK